MKPLSVPCKIDLGTKKFRILNYINFTKLFYKSLVTKITKNNKPKIKIIAAVLDWGLGHTTRCVPIFKEMILQGFDLSVACTESQKQILQKELPSLKYHHLKGYNITYSQKGWMFPIKILIQLPKIFLRLNYEKRWLKQYIKSNEVDIIFSDNRPGFRLKSRHSVYMTHQLSIKTGFRLTDLISSRIHQVFIGRFNSCWVPDDPKHTVAGDLSRWPTPNTEIRYIGPLSRMENNPDDSKRYVLACILSGPEPQRTLLEKSLLLQLKEAEFKSILIRGKASNESSGSLKNLEVVDYMSGEQLNEIMNSSELILCRSGYSSVMDLIKLGQKAVLIPTPGQGEQEYLAWYMYEKKHFLTASQYNFKVKEIVDMYRSFPFRPVKTDFMAFKGVVKALKEQFSSKEKHER